MASGVPVVQSGQVSASTIVLASHSPHPFHSQDGTLKRGRSWSTSSKNAEKRLKQEHAAPSSAFQEKFHARQSGDQQLYHVQGSFLISHDDGDLGVNGNTMTSALPGNSRPLAAPGLTVESHNINQRSPVGHTSQNNDFTISGRPNQTPAKYNMSGTAKLPQSKSSPSGKPTKVPDPFTNARAWLQGQGLTVVELMAKQLLEIFARSLNGELLDFTSRRDSWRTKMWDGISATFDQSIHTYELRQGDSGPFLDGEALLQRSERSHQQIFKVNLVIAIRALLNPSSDGILLSIHDHFRKVLCSNGEAPGQWQIRLLASLKLQCFLNPPGCSSDFGDYKRRLLEDKDSEGLQSQTTSFEAQSGDGSQYLLEVQAFIRSSNSNEAYHGSEFDREFKDNICRALPYLKDFAGTAIELMDLPPINLEETLVTTANGRFNNDPVTVVYPASTNNIQDMSSYTFDQDEMVRHAALAAHAALMGQYYTDAYDQHTPVVTGSSTPKPSASDMSYQDDHTNTEKELPATPNHCASPPTPEPSSSIQEQYSRARLAASAKAASKKAPPPNASQRRAWTQEEENALMTGLDRVQGPHWSQILAMYGPGGTISEVLRDRNQVQLKDKARNLKLFFLKSGHEVPHYLQHVTGELKTRAPATAAKQEARQRLRESASEDKAAADAINVLAGGRSDGGAGDSSHDSPPGLPNVGAEVLSSTQGRQLHDYDDEEDAEGDDDDEMMASAIQQALAVSRSTNV